MSKDIQFRVQISVRRTSDDAPVFQKQDGGRFDSEITVKMNVKTKYTLLFTTRPAKLIKKVLLKGEPLEIEVQKAAREEDKDKGCIHHAEWITDGCDVTKSNARSYLPILVEMDDGAQMTTNLQVKFYPETEETHSKWGQEFHLLEIECKQKFGSSAIEIVRQQFI